MIHNQKTQQSSKPKDYKSLITKRLRKKTAEKIKNNLSNIFVQKTQEKRANILKLRQEKLLKFRINYIPMCSDEDWEAMAAFYSKEEREKRD